MRAGSTSPRRSAMLRAALPVGGAIALVAWLGACGLRDESIGASLPPLTVQTTTSTEAPTTSTQPRYYKVQRGDTISSIASAFGVSQQELVTLNGITDIDHIQAGQTLQLPPSTVVVTAPPASG